MKPYLDLLRRVLTEGERRADRTGTGTLSVFGTQTRYDLREGFPLVTTKKVNFSAVVKELLWFLRGETNVRTLGCGIWDAWCDATGDIGPGYGAQWRNLGGRRIDQISEALHMIKIDPSSRRIIVNAWNVEDVPRMALPPCHLLFQFYVSQPDRSELEPAEPSYLDCQLYQRSADLAIGVPFNIASYALLMHMVAQECSLTPRYFVHTIGDAHIYRNHVEGVKLQLERETRPLPSLSLANRAVLDMRYADITLQEYHPHPAIKFQVAV